MELLLLELAQKYPIVVGICAVIGVFRVVFKPAFAVVKAFVVATPGKGDDEAIEKFEASKIYKGIVFVVDYLTSIKLPGSK